MAVRKEDKILCADRLVSMIEEDLRDFGQEEVIESFKLSETYKLLYNIKTRL